jgi:hypothetical protein
MRIPSIKGTAFQSAVEDLQRLLSEGQLSRDELERELDEDEVRLLDEKVNAASWYPMELYARMIRLLAEKEARGRKEDYLVRRGTRAAERIRSSGIYRQLDLRRETWGERVGQIVVTISGVMYNFTRWHIEETDGVRRFKVVVEDASEFPDEALYTAQGFVEFVCCLVSGSRMRVTSSRPTPDRIVYEVRDLGR